MAPEWIRNKKATINPQCDDDDDDRCFERAVITALFCDRLSSNRSLYSSYKKFSKEFPSFEGLTFPVPIEHIPIFEQQNSIAVSVFGQKKNEEEIRILYRSKFRMQFEKRVFLYVIQKDDEAHYVAVSNLNRLLNKNAKHPKFYCQKCFLQYKTQQNADDCRMCEGTPAVLYSFPEEKQYLEFKNFLKKMMLPFIVVADGENFIQATDDPFGKRKAVHVESCFGFYVISADPGNNFYWQSDDNDKRPRIKQFFDKLYEVVRIYHDYIDNPQPMVITEEQEAEFQEATHCWICEKELGNDRVRDHCHVSGLYRGPAHNDCNLNLRLKNGTQYPPLPVFFHNISYDGHFIISEASKYMGMVPLERGTLPKTAEDYIAIRYTNIDFRDSYKLMPMSLEKLVNNLPEKQLKFTQKEFPGVDIKFLKRKGMFPYSAMTGEEFLQKEDFLPREAFFDDLSQTECTEEDYNFAIETWEMLKQRNNGKMNWRIYRDFYQKLDVMQLADCLTSTRKYLYRYFELDIANYYSAPSFAWDSAIKKSKALLEILTDPIIYQMFLRSKRGGFVIVALRYALANNPNTPVFDEIFDISWIMKYDMTNAYGKAMTFSLPYKDFVILSQDEVANLDLQNLDDDGKFGYLYEVDLHFPAKLHDLMQDFPICPDNISIVEEMRSQFSRNIGSKKSGDYLIGHFYLHEKYVLDYRYLKLALTLGIKMVKVHRVVRYRQKPMFKPFVEQCTELRIKASKNGNKFHEELAKLLVNSGVFGKSLEDTSKYFKFKFATSKEQLKKKVGKPTYAGFIEYSEPEDKNQLFGVKIATDKVVLDKPIYIGTTILDLSKMLMADFYYNVLKKRYGENVRLITSDTDSFNVLIETENVYEDMAEPDFRKHLDLHKYPKDSPLYSEENRLIPGFFKEDLQGKIGVEAVALRSKCYAISYIEDSQLKTDMKCSGVPEKVVKNQISVERYKECLVHGTVTSVSYQRIESKNHVVSNVVQEKVALSRDDPKRFILPGGLDSLPYGHFRIPMIEEE
jgi:hypothetical protein